MTATALRQSLAGERLAPEGSKASLSGAPKLDALTSLRFFCAAGIIYLHCDGLFNVYWGTTRIEWTQFLSCFFVLSGFILSYVYPKLDSAKDCLRFLRARLARVYPATFVAMFVPFAIGIIPFSGSPDFIKVFLADLFLIQAWIPQSYYYFSINAPAWSISTEFFFYLMFLPLIQNIASSWFWKLLVAAGVTAACILVSATLNLPDTGDPFQVTTIGTIYINPLSRTFEFVVGMAAGALWQRVRQRPISPFVASVAEVMFLVAIAYYMYNSSGWFTPLSDKTALLRGVRIWLLYSGNCFFFAGLIACLALQKGIIAKILSNKTLVWLGELSFSMYLLHIFGREYYQKFQLQFSDLNNWFCFAVYLGVLVIVSHLMYDFVETPLRSLIGRGRLPEPGPKSKYSSSRGVYALRVVALAEIAILAITFVCIKRHIIVRNRIPAHLQASL